MISKQDQGVVSLYFDVQAGWEQWFLLMSDNHHDSIYCNRELELQHLQLAKAKGAHIFILGDLFDAMQGRFDPRRSYKELRPEYRCETYYDTLVDDFIQFYGPYAKNIALVARGNHETSCITNVNIDLTDRLVRGLNKEHGTAICTGGFGGWVRFMFTVGNVPKNSLKMKYFHGAGASAPVTKGVIQSSRQAVYLPDADIVVNGHNHESYYVPITRERITSKGVLYIDNQHHIRIPGYKQEYADGSGGWAVERGAGPKPNGCAWLRLYWDHDWPRVQIIMDVNGPQLALPPSPGSGS